MQLFNVTCWERDGFLFKLGVFVKIIWRFVGRYSVSNIVTIFFCGLGCK